jgi:AcrR family transcriptional regulator
MPRRGGTSRTSRRCSTPLAVDGFARLGAALDGAVAPAGPAFARRMAALARAYVAFATGHAALLDLMFAGKHDPAATPELAAAADRAFAAPIALIAGGQAAGEVVAGEPDRVAAVTWAALHGLATLASRGLLPVDEIDTLVDDTVRHLLDGLRPRG